MLPSVALSASAPLKAYRVAGSVDKAYKLCRRTLTYCTLEALVLCIVWDYTDHIAYTLNPCTGTWVLVALWVMVMQ